MRRCTVPVLVRRVLVRRVLVRQVLVRQVLVRQVRQVLGWPDRRRCSAGASGSLVGHAGDSIRAFDLVFDTLEFVAG